MRYLLLTLCALVLFSVAMKPARAANLASIGMMVYGITGGGKDEEKKKKHVRSLKKAKSSAKEAKYAASESRRQVMALAKVRNFFHNTFNSKPGTYRNFRSARVQNRWKKSNSNKSRFINF